MTDERREKLEEALREYAAEQGYLLRWAVVLEVERADGTGKMLMQRDADAARGGGLTSWDRIALHRPAVLTAEQDLLRDTESP